MTGKEARKVDTIGADSEDFRLESEMLTTLWHL